MPSNNPVALRTAPSGKVTKWGAQGTDEVFSTKAAAQAYIDAQAPTEAPAAPGKPVSRRAADKAAKPLTAERRADLAEQAVREVAEALPAPKAGTKAPAAPAVNQIDTILPEGVTLDVPKKSGYARVLVNGKSIGYAKASRNGIALEVLTSRLKAAKASVLEGTVQRGNLTLFKVTDAKSARQATAILTSAAAPVAK